MAERPLAEPGTVAPCTLKKSGGGAQTSGGARGVREKEYVAMTRICFGEFTCGVSARAAVVVRAGWTLANCEVLTARQQSWVQQDGL